MVSQSLVIDCSSTVPWFIHTEQDRRSEALLQEILSGHIELIVPDLWWYETMNVIRNAILRKRINEKDARQIFRFLRQIPKKIIEVSESGQYGILKMAIDESLSVYDATYLFAAITTGSQLITSDRDLLALKTRYSFISNGIK